MTAAAAPSVRRPGRRALFPEALPDPEGEAAAAIASLRFTVTLADRSKTIDLTMLAGRKALARTFAGALWRACQVGGPAGSISILTMSSFPARTAVVSTAFGDGRSYARVVADGLESTDPVELAGPESVEDLLLLLLMESDTPRHASH